MVNIQPLQPHLASQYDAYLTTQAHANSYHTRAWLTILEKTYGYQPASLVALEGDHIVGVLPLMRVHGRLKGRRLVSLPFSHAVPILAASPEVETALLNAAIELTQAENYSYLELKPRQPLTDARFQPSLLNYISELDLTPSVDDLFEAFTTSNRRNVRKGEKSGFTIQAGATPENLSAFYELEIATRRHQGAPIYHRHFFQTLAAELGDQVRVYIMRLEGEPVAGMVLMQRGKMCIYGYGAWSRAEHLKRLYPMNALVWHAIQHAKAEGCTVFDFGTTPRHNEGLLDFKQRYNPTLSDLPYWYFLHTRKTVPIIKRDGGAVKYVEKILQQLPRTAFIHLTPLLLREVG